MAVQLILVQFVEVRILVGQQVTRDVCRGFCFCGNEPSLLERVDAETKLARPQPGVVTWVMQMRRWITGGR